MFSCRIDLPRLVALVLAYAFPCDSFVQLVRKDIVYAMPPCFVNESIRWEPWTWFIHRLGCSEKRTMARCKVTWVVCFFLILIFCIHVVPSDPHFRNDCGTVVLQIAYSVFPVSSNFLFWHSKGYRILFKARAIETKTPQKAETVVWRLRTPRHDSALVLVWPTQQRWWEDGNKMLLLSRTLCLIPRVGEDLIDVAVCRLFNYSL